ncbi:MAG TPA: cadherin-like domain-containing protein, partial [Planctomycetes bacterium]|nr:cadherin-like domain-containing protein [Planctomycetota bacterium]
MHKRFPISIFSLVCICLIADKSRACNQYPIAVIDDCPKYVLLDEVVQFDGSNSYDPDGYITAYDWDFPPGASDIKGDSTAEPNCVFESAGIYLVKLRVQDDENAWSTWDSCNVFVATDPNRVHNIIRDKWFSHIQLAIDDANEMDELEVQQGTCYEFVDFGGKDLVLRSCDPNDWNVVAATIIDANYMNPAVTFYGTESSDCKLLGLTLTKGYGPTDDSGGGIWGASGGTSTNATVSNCIIKDNVAKKNGGAIRVFDGLIDRCRIFGNSTINNHGGGLSGCNGVIRNCLIYNNTATLNGGGMVMCNGEIVNCTVADNTAGVSGGGIAWCDNATITNCIIWGNDHNQVSGGAPTYSCIQNWTGGGEGNISTDPNFVDPDNGIYHLNSISTCIDTGDPNGTYTGQFDIDGQVRVMDGDGDANSIVDMGADEYIPAYIVGTMQGYATIQGAIDAALAGYIVEVAPGTHTGEGNRDLDFGGKAITVRSYNPENPAVVASTVIDCDGSSSEPHRAFYFHSGEEPNSIVDGFNIINGYGLSDCEYQGQMRSSGGGISCYQASPTIKNCVFKDNDCGFCGGAIHCYFSDAQIKNCLIEENHSGDIAVGIYSSTGNPIISDCIIRNNIAEQSGAGIWIKKSCGGVVKDCLIERNVASAKHSGGIFVRDGSPQIVNCKFYANSAGATNPANIEGGGGLKIGSSGATVINCIFVGNTSNQYGGGIFISDDSNVTISGCSFTENSAAINGGAITSRGGSSTVANSVLWSNSSPEGGEIGLLNSSTLEVRYSDVEGGQTGVAVETGSTLTWGAGNIDSDPIYTLDPNAGADSIWGTADDDYGDISLRSSCSPCIDAGDNSDVPVGITTDHNGDDRFVDDPYSSDKGIGTSPIVDMGAYEFPDTTGRNQPPIAYDDFAECDAVSIVIDVLFNDCEPEGQDMTVSLEGYTAALHGIVNNNGDDVTYTPDGGFIGIDSFTYRACDSQDCSNAATVTVDVVNDAPVAEPDSYEVFSTSTLVVDAEEGLLANDSDANDDELEVEVVENVPAGGGALLVNSEGSFTFNPNSEDFGQVTFTYKAIDERQAESGSATVTIDLIKLTAGVAPVHINLSSAETVNLDGAIEGSEGDGVEGVDSVQWHVIPLAPNGSSDVQIGGYTKENPDTTATFSEPGRYSIYLEAMKGGVGGNSNKVDILVESAINEAPNAEAGDNQVIIWPNNTVSIDGGYSDDGLPYGQVKPTWSLLSSTRGGGVLFGDPNAWCTTVTFSRPDSYVLQLEAYDYGKSGYDTCRVVVEERFPPDANAGADAVIPFPPEAESVSYTFEKDGTGANGVYVRDHTGADYSGQCTIIWEPVGGEMSAVSFDDAQVLGTTVTFTAPGQYVLRLYAKANDTGLWDEDFVAIEVTGEYPLEVYAGADQTIFGPGISELSAELAGEVLKGEPDTTRWSLIEGAGLVTFEDPNCLITEVRFNWPGTYRFELKAESAWGQATDEVEITVRTMMVAGGAYHTLFLDEHGILWACGKNPESDTEPTGVLGVGSDKAAIKYPMRVVGPEGEGFLENIVCIEGGTDLSLAVDKDGYVWSWGVNNYGVLGAGTDPCELPDSPIPVQVAGGEMGTDFLQDIVKVATSGSTALALDKYGCVWAWGSNCNAKLGNGSYTPEYEASPIQVMNENGLSPLEDIIDIDVGRSCIALDKQGCVWSWGGNPFTESGGEPNFLAPVCIMDSDPNRIESPGKVVDVAAGGQMNIFALTKAGEVWSWGGYNHYYGQLGCGGGTCYLDKPSPRKVVSGDQDGDFESETPLKDIIAISSGPIGNLALEENGKVWQWGAWHLDYFHWKEENGDKSIICWGNMPAPAEVTNRDDPYNLTGASYINASRSHYQCYYAIDREGQFWAWGPNGYGNLGLGFTGGTKDCNYGVPLPQPVPLGRVFNVTQGKRYGEIQRAIDEADDGDEIVVYEGYFFGEILFPDDGRDIILRSSDPYNPEVVANTIITDSNSLRAEKDVVTITGNSVIEGFTITGGVDGIVCVEGSSPVIRNNIIRDNGENGIYCGRYSTPFIENNIIVNNGSSIAEEGDGISLHRRSTAQIRNNTIVRNYRYGIIRNDYHQAYQPEIINCIIWSDGTLDRIVYPEDPNCPIYNCPDPNYCCIEGWPEGEDYGVGNINSDPCFVNTDPNVNDYHLRPVSPCINAGDPCYISTSTDYDGEPRIMGCRVDIGADEYAHLKVEAGGYKHTTLTSPDVKLADASVLYNEMPDPPGAVTVEWSRIEGPTNGVTFDDSNKVKTTATFCMAGTYVLKLIAFEDDCVAGEDIVQVDVGLGVEAGASQIIDISDPNAFLAGDIIEFWCGIGLKGWWKL